MSIDFDCFLAMLLVTKPCAVVLSFCIGVGGCLCPISDSVTHIRSEERYRTALL